jgi:hypothetical protein
MDTKVSLSKAALVMLFHPNPDDPDGPLGTFRPIIHQIPWHADPSPDPWKARVVVRAVIDRSVTLYQLAEIMSASAHSSDRDQVARKYISEFVEEFCRSPPHRFPIP